MTGLGNCSSERLCFLYLGPCHHFELIESHQVLLNGNHNRWVELENEFYQVVFVGRFVPYRNQEGRNHSGRAKFINRIEQFASEYFTATHGINGSEIVRSNSSILLISFALPKLCRPF